MTYTFTEEEIDFTMEMIRDLIPYDTPNFVQKLREMAIGCLRAERDTNLILFLRRTRQIARRMKTLIC